MGACSLPWCLFAVSLPGGTERKRQRQRLCGCVQCVCVCVYVYVCVGGVHAEIHHHQYRRHMTKSTFYMEKPLPPCGGD